MVRWHNHGRQCALVCSRPRTDRSPVPAVRHGYMVSLTAAWVSPYLKSMVLDSPWLCRGCGCCQPVFTAPGTSLMYGIEDSPHAQRRYGFRVAGGSIPPPESVPKFYSLE